MADPSILPTYLLSKFTKEKVTVALAGDGGDEMFAGYPTYQAHILISYYNRLPLFARKGINGLVQTLPVSHQNFSFDFKAKQFFKRGRASCGNPQLHLEGRFFRRGKN